MAGPLKLPLEVGQVPVFGDWTVFVMDAEDTPVLGYSSETDAGLTQAVALARAEQVARAVNCHDALVAACETALNALAFAGVLSCTPEWLERRSIAQASLLAALAKAKA